MQWFGAAPLTARGREIAKSREELLGLLHGLPAETEFELSLTDLFESSSTSTSTDHLNTQQEEEIRNVNQLQEHHRHPHRHPDKEETRKKKARRRSSSSSSSSSSFERSRSSSSGVLLNMYFPTSLTRSLTSSSASRSKARPKDAPEFTKRDTGVPILFSCWSAIWYRKSDKSRRRKAA